MKNCKTVFHDVRKGKLGKVHSSKICRLQFSNPNFFLVPPPSLLGLVIVDGSLGVRFQC
jgi:hypothetical protein